MDELTSTAGVAAVAAGALALIALIVAVVTARRMRRLRKAQSVVLGDSGERDLVAHAQRLHTEVARLTEELGRSVEELRVADGELSRRLDGAVTHCAVVRYDALGEMTGRQSSSVALLDGQRNGVVFSSILHREQARLYAKPVVDGQSELHLSPEEHEAVRAALEDG